MTEKATPSLQTSREELIGQIADIIRLEGNPPTAILRLSWLNKARTRAIALKVLEKVEAATRSNEADPCEPASPPVDAQGGKGGPDQ